MTAFRAFHLPRKVEVAEEHLEPVELGEVECQYPRPEGPWLPRVLQSLRMAADGLMERPVHSVVTAVDAVAGRLLDPQDPLRHEALELLPRVTGYSPAMAALVLDRMAVDWRAEPLQRLIASSLPDPDALDRFIETGSGRRVRGIGPALSLHVFAGNVPGVAVTSLIRSLLVKSPVLGKLASGEPVLPVLFARALAEVDPELGEAVALTYWPGGHAQAENLAMDAAELVVVYGSADTIRSWRQRLPPHCRLVEHGPRLSVGLVSLPTDPGNVAELAGDVAAAVAAFDQHGCVSPHAIWVSGPADDQAGSGQPGNAGRELAGAVSEAMSRLEPELPRGRVSSAEAAAIQQERGAAELRAHAGDGVEVWAGEGTRWTVILDPNPRFRPSCLNRLIRIHPVPSLEDALEQLSPVGEHLQSVALVAPDGARDELATRLARIGATRITTFRDLPWPPAEWHHDGQEPLVELLRWVDLEP